MEVVAQPRCRVLLSYEEVLRLSPGTILVKSEDCDCFYMVVNGSYGKLLLQLSDVPAIVEQTKSTHPSYEVTDYNRMIITRS